MPNLENKLEYSQNKKMKGSPIVMCPEIEGIDKCIYFGTGMCKNCYAENLWQKRKTGWRGKSKTPPSGLIRLGTWREILPEDYMKFKELFPERDFFLITRGLLSQEFYSKIDKDSRCRNIQASVDINEGESIPNKEKLKELLALKKVLFRFKTMDSNVTDFMCLAAELEIPKDRILETPLRLGGYKGHKNYQATPLSEHWDKGTYWVCNTECADCAKENGVLVCVKRF